MPLDQQDLRDALRAAIGAHGIWKQRLRTAIAVGSTQLDPELTACAGACQFGQWLAGLPPRHAQTPEARRVAESHVAFHKAAGEVAAMVKAGRKAEAEADLSGGRFNDAADSLAVALAAWLRAA